VTAPLLVPVQQRKIHSSSVHCRCLSQKIVGRGADLHRVERFCGGRYGAKASVDEAYGTKEREREASLGRKSASDIEAEKKTEKV
jgi:hypothetical protein